MGISSSIMRVSCVLLGLSSAYVVDQLPEANDKLQVFGLPMGHGDGTIIMCPKTADGNGGEISIFDLGTIVKYYQWWDGAKLLNNREIRYMFMAHADETHTSFFPKVFPIEEAETETYPNLSKLEAIYHTCPVEQNQYGLPVDNSVVEWLEYHSDKTVMINDGEPYGTEKCVQNGGDLRTCTCSDDRKIQLCPSSPQINFNFLAANLGSCEPNRFGQVDSDKDSLVAQIEWGTFKMLLTGDNKSDEQLAMVDFYSGLGTGELNNVTVLKAASHGSDFGTQQQLVDLTTPEMMFYSSAHLNQDWSSGDCNIYKRLNGHVRRIPAGNDDQVQSELNCYDPWAQDLPEDQPIRSIVNNQRRAIYSTTYGTRYQETSGNYLYTWPCNVNRIDIETDGTSENTIIRPVSQGTMPSPPCMKPDFWQEN